MESPMMRSLPQSIEAEQSVIGAMIIDKSAIAQVFEKLNEDDFYRDGHKVIYKAIREMYAKDMAVDLVTILEYLKTTDMLDKAGGVTYISELSSSVPTTASLTSGICFLTSLNASNSKQSPFNFSLPFLRTINNKLL